MALAVRRLVLRSRAINARDLVKISSSLTIPQAPSQTVRRLHAGSRCLADNNNKPDSSKRPSKDASKSSKSSSKTSDTVVAHESASTIPSENEPLSLEQQEIASRTDAWSQELGRPLNKHEITRVQQDFVVHLVETGQKDRLQSLMKADGLSPEMMKEIQEIHELNEKLEQEELQYSQLADTLEQAGTDPAVLDPLLDKLALTREDLETGRIIRQNQHGDITEGIEARDEEDLERQVYEKMQRLRGVSESAIAEERRQDQLEELLIDQDPQTRRALDLTMTATRLRDIANDERLLRTLQNEGSLFELWKRLGWNDENGKAVKRDLVVWEQLLRIAHPDSRKILLKVRDRDRRFADDFYSESQMQLLEQNKREKPGFWNYEDDDMGEDETFQQDDLPRVGHQELELKREIRKYARLMVWELPLLSKLAKPFNPPSQDQLLRFRYTTYMGEKHPSEHKVVIEFSPSRLELTNIERSKLIKLAGPRYNPSTGIIKISCESFETAAQNKRYLGDQVEVLIKEAKDATDTFADVPYDFRHHKPKPFHHFPEAWKLTPERKAALLAARAQARAVADVRMATGAQLDGRLYLPGGPEQRTAEASRTKHIQEEHALVLDSDTILTEREREALLVQRTGRLQADKLAMVADRKARRPAKRDRYVAKALNLQRRMGPVSPARPAASADVSSLVSSSETAGGRDAQL